MLEPTKPLAQAAGFVFVLHPKLLTRTEGVAVQESKPIRQERVFVVDMTCSKIAVVHRVLLQAAEVLRLAKQRLTRMGLTL